ncbi:MAG: translocation/assembly module TamB domain-containing protein [Gemmatimonadota bacterium]
MSRRRTVVLASAATLFALGALIVAGIAALTQTSWGREQIRAQVVSLINSKLHGKMYIGRIDGSLFTSLVVDSFAIRELNDSLFLSTGPIHIRFDPRDLLDRRIVASEVTVERPVLRIVEDSTKVWNFRRIFPSGPPQPLQPLAARALGDYIFVNSARVENATVLLGLPWQPDDSLHGSRRDSAIAVALARTDKRIIRVGNNFQVERSWTNGTLVLGPSRIDDKDALGRQFDVKRLDADEFDPPFNFREARGAVRNKGDSIWADIPYFRLPGSRGTAKGKVWWGSDLPTRYDLTFVSDSLSLADVAWVYPTLPTSGGGQMTLHIGNGRDLHVLEYALRDMDVRTMNSRLRGAMTFGTGAPVLVVKDVDLRADPIDWILIEQFTGEPLPYPFRGTIVATVKAKGGPVDRFELNDGSFLFRDANVPGATAQGKVNGELDILFPALTKFRGVNLALDHFDLRTIQFVNPAFPRFFGLVSGTARLDSVWTDLRFRNADITHRFEDGEPSRFTGNGRVTIGEKFLVYDLALDARPLSLTTVARAYPEAQLMYRGTYTGPIRLQGQADDLALATELTGAPGTLAYDGRVDADSVDGYGYHGTLRFSNLDLRLLLDTTSVPHTQLNGTAELDVVGDSLANWEGPVDVALGRSLVDSVRLYAGARARLRFGGGAVRVDSLSVESALASFTAKGGLGLLPGVRDSLAFTLTADSLGALRQYLVQASGGDSLLRAEALSDSLGAEINGRGVLIGSVDSLDVRGAFDVRNLTYGTYGAKVARVSFNLEHVLFPDVSGTVNVTADTLALGTVAVTNAGIDLDVKSARVVNVGLLSTLSNGPVLEGRGMFGVSGDTTVAAISSLRIGLDGREWKLAQPASFHSASGAFLLDTVRLTGSSGGQILLAGSADADSTVRLRLEMDSVSLADVANLAQSNLVLGGWLATRLDVTGTRSAPVMALTGGVKGATVGQVNVARASLQGNYSERRIRFGANVLRNDSSVVAVTGNVPVDLALLPRDHRLLRDGAGDTLRVSVKSTALDMPVVESFLPGMSNATGRVSADFSLAGTVNHAALEGYLRIDSVSASLADLGIRLRNMNADLVAARDTLRIQRFSVVSGSESRDSLWLSGWVARLADEGAAFDVSLGARDFQAIANRRVAELTVSGGLRLDGSFDRSRLSGGVTLNSGVIVIPEFTGKKLISLDDPELYNVVDTTVFANRALLPKTSPEFVRNLTVDNVRIAMGSDVRVRSEEADIKLGGAVNVTVGERRGETAPQLALDGALQTERGYYRLDLGGLVQRTFTVEGGELRFLNETELNPILNISAIHTVRQISSSYGGRNDVRIRVRVQGTLTQPRLRLESADSLQLSESDLISYLVAGVPSFGIGGGLAENRFSASSFALSTLSSYISAKFSGGLFDYVNIQTATGNSSGREQQSRQGLLNGVQFGIGKQLGERTFLSLTTGLCRLGAAGGQLSPVDLAQIIGVKLEQRLADGYGFSFSLEPPLDKLFCDTGTDRSFGTTRRQYGLDLFRSWRW